jgi:hypothetical protein
VVSERKLRTLDQTFAFQDGLSVQGWHSAGLIGLVLLVTAFFRICPLYQLLGMRFARNPWLSAEALRPIQKIAVNVPPVRRRIFIGTLVVAPGSGPTSALLPVIRHVRRRLD